MKKILLLTLLMLLTSEVSGQKMTIKTNSGQQVEIICEGLNPSEVIVINDSIVFKLPNQTQNITQSFDDKEDSVDTFVPVAQDDISTAQTDSVQIDSLTNTLSSPSATALIANSIAETLSPEYAQFNQEHENDHPESEKALIKDVAKQFVNEDVVEAADLVTTLFSGLRFTKDTTFVPTYEQRKPKPRWRYYNTIELGGSLGKNIQGVAPSADIKYDDYGDDLSNENKWGGDIKLSRTYIKGEEKDSVWVPNPLGLAYSWGGLIEYNYEKDMGSYASIMGKVGVQIGNEIAIGVDALVGCGITPYNTFFTNNINHSVLNKSAFCFKYGLQLWGSLNFFKDTYTAIYGRYICSVKPSSDSNLPEGWRMVIEDFDPSSWTVGLAVGYKFGAYSRLSTDKRLQIAANAGYQFFGDRKGPIFSIELDRFSQVSRSTSLSYGLAVEELFEDSSDSHRYSSFLASVGFRVQQPYNRFFWGTKLYGGVGDYLISIIGENYSKEDVYTIKKLCTKVALQLNAGFQISKCGEIFTATKVGYHFGNKIDADGFDECTYEGTTGFSLNSSLGYRFTF